ncbi:MAG TPA: hypothetical protein PKY24_05445 [Opitutaceae bacterium]|jgi:hypothetical protein|nr:hypothetical protein [Opitutaceae bacterium]HOG92526.1 hypothetical protein [Opitutaceae bacterium]HPG17212.1 hypothetical protein [Opitutaceae bacterium]HPK49102.1 hypothetical protein [Opitutaceae bacterium]HQL21463.1 hypothetical protein [Opitutaceae bacterium]
MKIRSLLITVAILGAVGSAFYRLESVRKAEDFYDSPTVPLSQRGMELLVAEYDVRPQRIPLEKGELLFLHCWAEYEVTVPFWPRGTPYRKTGRIRLVFELDDGANNFGVEQRLRLDEEYAKQRFIRGSVNHRLAWRYYPQQAPVEMMLERRNGDTQIQTIIELVKKTPLTPPARS